MIESFNSFQVYAQANPVIAGAMSLWGMGVLTYLCRKIPEHIWTFITTHLTTELYLDSSENGKSELNFMSFMQWFERNGYSKWSRTMALDSASEYSIFSISEKKSKDGMHCSIGEGFHFFFRNYKLFWLYRKKIEKPGIAKNLYSISLHYFGRNKQIMHDLISEFVYVPDGNKIGVYSFDGYWEFEQHINPRKLNTVILDKNLKKDMLNMLDQFMVSKNWYELRGLPYKKTIILHGVPGTGKTSIIKALADHYSRNICMLNLGSMDDKSLALSLSRIPEKSFVVIEDCDSSYATKSRETKIDVTDDPKTLSLSGLLNALDGLMSLNDSVIFLTTNHLNSIDTAITRKGRIDHIYEFKSLQDEEIKEYIDLMFPDHPEIIETFYPILGCDLQAIYFEHAQSYSCFLSALPKMDDIPFPHEYHCNEG